LIDLRDLRSLGKHWNDIAMQRIAASWPDNSRSRVWPMFGMLVIGLVAGAAIGGYAMSQRAEISRLAQHVRRMRGEVNSTDNLDVEPVTVTTHRINSRRKTGPEA
jgi:HAMP domain-containing protein